MMCYKRKSFLSLSILSLRKRVLKVPKVVAKGNVSHL